jgi:hypothetical protein
MKSKKTKKKANKVKDEVRLELDGQVNIVEVKNGKKTSTPIDGRLVLKLLMRFLEEAVEEACKKELKTKK